ncbi:putative peroxidase-related enzyme [Hydrogenophaga sp. T4]|nr:putative peroxidase-related enzyme [Hydrogenophaga sp. T4]
MSAAPYIQQLKPVVHSDAQGAQKEILDTALKQVGFIPNMYANMVNAPAVLSTYLHGYGLFRKESGLTPTEQEVVFLAVSRTNGCKYCTAAHSMIADKMSGVPAPVLQAIRSHQPFPIRSWPHCLKSPPNWSRAWVSPALQPSKRFSMQATRSAICSTSCWRYR